MKKIKLTQGKYALVDDKDYEWLNQWKWSISKTTTKHYAIRRIKGTPVFITMHRQLLGLKRGDGKRVDHINGNSLDNRRSNLRLATASQNNWNAGRNWGTSKYKGVAWVKKRKKWRAKINVYGKQVHGGFYTDEIEAAKAHDRIARKHHKEFAYLNFPTDEDD